jgi:tetratricopeptide (TPR) repeat protein
LAYVADGRHSEKLKELQETLRLKPHFSEANFNIMLPHAALNRHHEASEYYRKSIKQEPNNYDSHYFLALSCFLSNRYQEALSAVQESIRINPNNAEAHIITLGQVYMKLKQYNKAIQPLQSAMNIHTKMSKQKLHSDFR